ncbi:MAG: glycosyltransferase family 9 protein, partial [Ferruginibacter sp.]
LGKKYTKALVAACVYIDQFIDEGDYFSRDVLIDGLKPQAIVHVRTNKQVALRAKALKIPLRIGTSSRLYHWFTCNRLVPLRRKTSTLHEAQLNIKLLAPLGIVKSYSTVELQSLFGLKHLEILQEQYAQLLQKGKFNIVIHPKSQGSSREWPLDHFINLINVLAPDKYNVILSGVEKEKGFVQQIIDGVNKPVINIAGKLPLGQFIAFLNACDGILANATGPLHVGAALGIHAFGIYPPIKPIHPDRWAPLGKKVHVFVLDKNCNDCKKNKNFCPCVNAIPAVEIKMALDDAALQKSLL